MLSKLKYILFSFFLTANTLFPIPVDKFLLLMAVLTSLVVSADKHLISKRFLFVALLICSIAVVGQVVNLHLDGMLFYPIVGLLFIMIFHKNEKLSHGLYYGLLIHILIGLLLYVTSYIEINPFVRTMADKGLPFVHASLGFTSTNQTFGTYCILWVLIYFDRQEQFGLQRFAHKIFYMLVILAILSTLNRSTFLFFILVAIYKDKKLIMVVLSIFIAIVIAFFQEISTFLLNASSLESRGELLEGFYKSYVLSDSFLVYLFGKGAVFIDEKVVRTVTWDTRYDIENGYAFLLHGYGILGFVTYLLLSFKICFSFFRKKMFYEANVAFFYLLFSVYFTQEFVSNTFYLIVTYILYLYLKKKRQQRLYL